MKSLLRGLLVSTFFLLLAISLVATEPPPRPRYPVKMDTLSDEALGKLFFAEIDLDEPSMAPVKPLALAGKYPEALAAWQHVFLSRVKAAPMPEWTTHNMLPVKPIMNPGSVLLQHGRVKDFGPPGKMDWYGLKDWELHVNMMWHPKALIRELETTPPHKKEYPTDALLERWRDVWRDYASNNWRIGMPLACERPLREAALAQAGLTTPPNEWGINIAFAQQLILLWPVMNLYEQLTHAMRIEPEAFVRIVTPRALAEIVYFTMVWPVPNLLGTGDAAVLVGGAPNQNQGKTTQLLRIGLLAPEFLRNQKTQAVADEMIRIVVAMPGHLRDGSDQSPDGSGTEFSYNYMKSLVSEGSEWLNLAKTLHRQPDWVGPVRQAVDYRRKFFANLATPTGCQPLCKGPWMPREKAPELPAGNAAAYTSIAFPWHGLYQMRSGWETGDLYLSLMNPRRGHGHASENGNACIAEAFGRCLLVGNSGEGSPYFKSSRAQNTVTVDGLVQQQLALPVHGVFEKPCTGRWHTSPHFDFAESRFSSGYGPDPVTKPKITLTDVQHQRQEVFVRGARLWLIVDTMLAPADQSHRYTQTWHFNSSFPKETVSADAATETIKTTDPSGANLFFYQAATSKLTYASYYGEGASGVVDMEAMPVTARGCHNTGGGYGGAVGIGKQVRPAVDIYADCEGPGCQTIVTALVPSPDTASPVTASQHIARAGVTGLALTLRDGSHVTVEVATNGADEHLIVQHTQPDGTVRGLRMDAFATTGTETLVENGKESIVASIVEPTAFRWVATPNGEAPEYR